jgi:hypothetical protein
VTGSEHPSGCYRLTAFTDQETYSVTTDGTGTASINDTSGQYSDGSTIDLEVQKVCSTATTEAVTYFGERASVASRTAHSLMLSID